MKSKKLFIVEVFVLAVICFVSTGIVHAQSITPSGTQSAPTPIPSLTVGEPLGQTVSLEVKIRGIGDNGGNAEPQRTTRGVSLYFFGPDVNAQDVTSKPISSYKTNIVYDADPTSPTFGRFVNSSIDLRDEIADGDYQIVIKMNQNLSRLIKKDPEDLGGEIFRVKKSFNDPIIITSQELIPGDIHPSPLGDNVMDINDYNGVVNCFGSKSMTESCPDREAADLDDNGIVDGTDYNIMFGGFKTLLDLGLPVPKFIGQVPTKAVTKAPAKSIKKVTPTPKVEKSATAEARVKGSSGNGMLVVATIFLFITLGVVMFVFRKKIKELFVKLTHRVPAGEASVSGDAAGEKIDKDYFVKKQTVNKEDGSIVLTLTDDNGPTLGYYSGGEVTDGFATVKGTLKKEGDKIFIDVAEITPVESS